MFDQPPGSLFIVRVAGHVLEPAALASVLYATRDLGVRLVIVLGHQSCGAVRATLSGASDDALEPLVAPIARRLTRAGEEGLDEDGAIRANARAAVTEVEAYLHEVGPELAELVTVCGAINALDRGEVDWLE